MSNPLLSFTDLPPFSQIKPEHVKPAIEQAKIQYDGNQNTHHIRAAVHFCYTSLPHPIQPGLKYGITHFA